MSRPEDTESVSLSDISLEQLKTKYLQLRLQHNELLAYRDQQDKGIALYHLITENIADLLAVIDPSGKRIWNNKAYFETLGYRPESLTNTNSFMEIHPDDREKVEQIFRESVQTGVGRKVEYRMKHQDGRWVELESRSTVVRNEGGEVECIVLVARDIGDRKRMEEELLQSQRMQSVATVSEKVSENFNARIDAILDKVNLARQLLKPGSPEAKLLADATDEGDKAHNLVGQLMSLGTSNVKSTEMVCLQDLLRDSLGRCVPSGGLARPEIYMPERDMLVGGSREVLAAAIDQILTNSVEAMDKRGIIRIDLVNERMDKSGALLKPGQYAVIRIRDQGTGIREEHISHIFEPYFTTKQGHQGLGLSSALAAISEHHGTLRIHSKPGTGAEAVIHLPVVTTEEPTKKLPRTDTRAEKRARILIMDDEKFVREFATALLVQLGYEAVATSNGDELVEEFRASCRIKRPYHVIITDLIVPNGVGGEMICERVKKLDPQVRVIVSSGFTNHHAIQNFRDYGFDASLSKPYRAESLRKLLDELLPS
ncbi:MAG: PAS domain S-box protein [Candidatus Methylacidiphilales bacterium]|nr:PAS domain S-box protein [Candidatus Methylacidiphilales bacterium]